jgi:hypothetical protein
MRPLILVAFTLAALTAAPAYADSNRHGHNDRGRHYDRGHHGHGWHDHNAHSRYSAPRFFFRTSYVPVYRPPVYRSVTYVTPPPVIYNSQPTIMASNLPAQDYCREYQATTTIGGQVNKSFGTACLQPDGSWKIIN